MRSPFPKALEVISLESIYFLSFIRYKKCDKIGEIIPNCYDLPLRALKKKEKNVKVKSKCSFIDTQSEEWSGEETAEIGNCISYFFIVKSFCLE